MGAHRNRSELRWRPAGLAIGGDDRIGHEHAIFIGPKPPGAGVIAPAILAHSSKTTSPTMRDLHSPFSGAAMRLMPKSCSALSSGIDQSHGRVRMRLEVPVAASVLSKETAVDLDAPFFPPDKRRQR
jgi:hypothetical protein